MFLRNFWYMAAWSDEVAREPVGYVLLNEPIVLFRKLDATPVAMEDRCAHRSMFLSNGYLRGDDLVCGYHGLTYDGTGTCVHIPGQENIPTATRRKLYPVVERDGCLWIWMGEPAHADLAQIPDMHWANDPGWGSKSRLKLSCNYQLINDNLTDLSHLGYVHARNVGTPDLAEHGKVETRVDGDRVVVSRWTVDKPAPRFWIEAGGFTTNIDRWQIVEFAPPSFCRVRFGAAPAGTTGDIAPEESSDRWGFQVFHFVTPIDEVNSYYFWAIAHDYGPERETATAAFYYSEIHKVIDDDVIFLEGQQRAINLNRTAVMNNINADGGLVSARRIIERLAEGERRDEAGQLHAGSASA